jgi:hypothetical protein
MGIDYYIRCTSLIRFLSESSQPVLSAHLTRLYVLVTLSSASALCASLRCSVSNRNDKHINELTMIALFQL